MALPTYETIILERDGRLLIVRFNRPDVMNAVNRTMHEELAEVFQFAQRDPESDVVLLTGSGRAFSAGGELDHIANNAANPHLFDEEVRLAKRIVYGILDMDKPLLGLINGHALGLGATLALLCDVTFVDQKAKIGDPHVALGLVAGDGGAVIWPQLIGLSRAKEFLLAGDLLSAEQAEKIGLINYALPSEELEAAALRYAERLLKGAQQAIRSTKVLLNMELKRIASSVMEAGIALESVSVRSADHREGVAALKEKRAPEFRGDAPDVSAD